MSSTSPLTFSDVSSTQSDSHQMELNAQFHEAVIENNLEKVKRYILEGFVDVDCKNDENVTATFVAIKQNYYELLKLLIINFNADVNVNDEHFNYDMTLASAACYNNNIDALTLLTVNGADINLANSKGQTPLYFSILQNSQYTFDYLMDLLHLNVNGKETLNQMTPLHLACERNNLNVIKKLCNRSDLLLNERDKDGDTPFHIACSKRNVKIINFLIECGCDTNVKNSKNMTPIEEAVFYESYEIIKLLIHHPKLDKNITNKMLPSK